MSWSHHPGCPCEFCRDYRAAGDPNPGYGWPADGRAERNDARGSKAEQSAALVVLPRGVDRYRVDDNASEVIARGTGLPAGDGDIGRAAVNILTCARQASLLGEAPERVSIVELETQTDIIAAEMLETQKRGVTRQRGGRWYFELKETEE